MSELVSAARELLGADVRPLSGGYSGETFLVGAAGEEAVLRLYLRDPDRAEIDAALLALVRGIVPVPRVLDQRKADTSGPAHLLLERLPGVRLDELLPVADAETRRAAGVSVGRVLARLAGIPYLRAGMFAGADLDVRPFPDGGLREWVESHHGIGAFARWTPEEFDALLGVADDGQWHLDRVGRVCLCHSDFNPKNVLVDAGTGEVTGLIDWEFAHAGSPYADLGNLLRLETDEIFGIAVVRTFVEYAPPVEDDFVDAARAADLFAIVDLVARRTGFELVERVHEVVRATARTGTLAAGRPDWATLADVTTATSRGPGKIV
jgi:aminoglycoside phosphotransferase (APT) family kinase protein